MGNVWLDIIKAEEIAKEAIKEVFDNAVFPTHDILVTTFLVWARQKGYARYLHLISINTDHDLSGWWVTNIHITT